MGLKEFVQNKLHEKNLKMYELEVARQSDAYQAYIDIHEKDEFKSVITLRDANSRFEAVRIINYDEFVDDLSCLDGMYSYIIFVRGDGLVPERLGRFVETAFDNDPNLNVIYFDEDEYDKAAGRRVNPWFKSDYGVDSILGSFYFGNIVAVRKSAIKTDDYTFGNNGLLNLYKVILDMCMMSEPVHESMVAFHRYIDDGMGGRELTGAEPVFDSIKEAAYRKLGYSASFGEDKYGISHAIISTDNPSILIVIPSKDHPEVLERCVKSIKDITTYSNYKVTVVDNGSSLDNKSAYEHLSNQYGFKYIYEERDFNFSYMCNTGAKSEDSEYIVLLNDDTEIVTANWLEIMAGQASLKHVGAVGAKLMYPGGELIQHAGITNMTEGPSHKLLGQPDSESIYHGVNRVDRDVIGVTAACLMVSRAKYEEVSGLNENLPVAYNDVYFCFALFIKGYLNVIRNDVILLHYESLSRGDDHKDGEKLMRLKNERRYLYSWFPQLYGYDPFYNKALTGASNVYECVLPFENRNIRMVTTVNAVKMPDVPVNETLIISVDRAEIEEPWNDNSCVLIDLHSHIRGLDNCDYSFRMMISKDGETYEIPVIRRIRPDVTKVLYNETHVELSGFVARIPREYLSIGTYEIWMEAKSLISRQILINKAESVLVID